MTIIKIILKQLLLVFTILVANQLSANAQTVVVVSVDGLYAPALSILGKNRLPNLYKLINEGASTLNARADPNVTRTLPNHTSMLTGRNVISEFGGHGWIINVETSPELTIHSSGNLYIPSILDVVHDNGGSTAIFASKDKFSIFDRSWNELSGNPDITGHDNGRDKIDKFEINSSNTSELIDSFNEDLRSERREYYLLHIKEPDIAGHQHGWNFEINSSYMLSIIDTDTFIGKIIDTINQEPLLKETTALVITADHGGEQGTQSHSSRSYQSHTIPFIVWGKNIPNGDLYNYFDCSTQPPVRLGTPTVREKIQPIRNSDAANLSAYLLNLNEVPSSNKKALIDFSNAEKMCAKRETFQIIKTQESIIIIPITKN